MDFNETKWWYYFFSAFCHFCCTSFSSLPPVVLLSMSYSFKGAQQSRAVWQKKSKQIKQKKRRESREYVPCSSVNRLFFRTEFPYFFKICQTSFLTFNLFFCLLVNTFFTLSLFLSNYIHRYI